MSDRVAVMYLGRVVEEGRPRRCSRAAAPLYAIAAVRRAHRRCRHGGGARIVLTGEIPSPASPPPGCRFHPAASARRLRLPRRAVPAVHCPCRALRPGGVPPPGPVETAPRDRRCPPRRRPRRRSPLCRRLPRRSAGRSSFLLGLSGRPLPGCIGLDGPLAQDCPATLERPRAVIRSVPTSSAATSWPASSTGALQSLIDRRGRSCPARRLGVRSASSPGSSAAGATRADARVDLLLALPGILLAMALIAVLGRSQAAALVAVGLHPGISELRPHHPRAGDLSAARDFVTAVEAFGASAYLRMVPHAAAKCVEPDPAQIVVLSSVAILLEAALAFLGIGIPRPRRAGARCCGPERISLRQPDLCGAAGAGAHAPFLAFDASAGRFRRP